MYDGHKVRPKDVIRLERGGTGFAATSKVEASTYTLLGVGSGAQGGAARVCERALRRSALTARARVCVFAGMADRRGQLAGGRSKFAGMRL